MWVGISLILVLPWHLLYMGLLRGTGVSVTGDRECPPRFPFAIFSLQLKLAFQPNGLGSAAHLAAYSVAQAQGTSCKTPWRLQMLCHCAGPPKPLPAFVFLVFSSCCRCGPEVFTL